ncbi:MAG: polyprenyl synthetase family protein [Pseudomonadales bacterium]
MTHPFYSVVADDFAAVNHLIADSLSSHIPLVEEISHYLIEAGGKRLRPLLVLLSANACRYNDREHIKLAAVIEFLHTAMLMHDDVVDDSNLRRGRKTVNARWGNSASVLVGDFLHSRAFEMMVQIGDMRVMEILSHATNTIAEGEVQQLAHIHNPDITEEIYLDVITRKTATLFQCAAHSASVLSGCQPTQEGALRDYGLHLGLAFQLIDDLLDYDGDTRDLGKNVGDDLAEGKVTLPLIAAIKHGDNKQKQFVRQAIAHGGVENLDEIMDTVRATGGLQYTATLANAEREKALACLDKIEDTKYQGAMRSLVNFVVDRRY